MLSFNMYKRKYPNVDSNELRRRYYLYVNNYYYEKSVMSSGHKPTPIDASSNTYVVDGYIENYFE